MSNQVIFYIMGGSVAVLVVIVLAYYILSKKMQKSEYRQIKKLQQGTQEKSFSTEVLYQKLYISYIRIPFLKRYILKLRRRLEIINIDDEYNTRKDSAKILTRALAIVIPTAILTIIITSSSYLLMFTLLIFELFMIDTLIDGSIDKKDTNLLKEQLDFFSEIRHAYHEFNMVEEAIYQVSQDDERDISRQGENIYEILIADDPEMELEKYYDIAPNIFLKEFAGISYLTKEFGDRKVNGASLYLKNVEGLKKNSVSVKEIVVFSDGRKAFSDVAVARIFDIPVDIHDKKYLYHLTQTTQAMHGADESFDVYATIEAGETVRLTGYTADKRWSRVMFDNGEMAFVKSEVLQQGIGKEIPLWSKIYKE